MKYFIFYREDDNFQDILNDNNIKKFIDEKIQWGHHLLIGIPDNQDKTISYITLLYGDLMKKEVVRDFSPVPGIDYIPKQDASKYKKVID